MKTLSPVSLTLYSGLLSVTFAIQAESGFEQPPILSAKQVLPDELQAGDRFKVRDEVHNDGYLNQFTVESDFGEFRPESTIMLRIRVKEIGALAELERVSKTEVFAKAAIEAGLNPARAVITFGKNPVGTVTGLPKGIGRMFKRTSRQVQEGADTAADAVSGDDDKPSACDDIEDEAEHQDCEEALAQRQRGDSLMVRYFKLSDAERQWHQKLGTDPYTSNDELYEAVKSVAWADRLGRFSVKFAGIPSVPGLDYLAKATDLVWALDPYELKDHNTKILTEAGLDEATIEAFFSNPWLTPSMQTRLVAALSSLESVTGRDHVVWAAIETETEAEARFVLESVVSMTWFNVHESPILKFLPDAYFPVALTEDSRIVILLPVDFLIWTEEMAELAHAEVLRYSDVGAESRELWLLGGISDIARIEIEVRDWVVKDRMAERIRQGIQEMTPEETTPEEMTPETQAVADPG